MADKRRISFDSENLPNYLLYMFKDQMTGEIFKFEKWKNRNTIRTKMGDFLTHFNEDDMMFTYNGNGYDMPMMKILIDSGMDVSYETMCDASHKIIHEGKRMKRYYPSWRHGDLQEILNLNRQTQEGGKTEKTYVSLKEAAANTGFPLVRDLPVNPEFDLTLQMKKDVYDYCIVDCDATTHLAQFASKDIALRMKLEGMYGTDVFNRGEPRVAREIMCHLYQQATGHNAWDLLAEEWGGSFDQRVLKVARHQYLFKNLIPKPTHFKWTNPEFKQAYEAMRNFSRGEFDKRFVHEFQVGDLILKSGEGGIHDAKGSPVGSWKTEGDWSLYQVDASSFYPYMIHYRNLHPRHLPGIRQLYWDLVNTRLDYKARGMKAEADSLKIVINSYYGMMGSAGSPFLSPDEGKAVPLTGQLYFMQIMDWLGKVNVEILSANTDGIMIRVHKSQEKDFRKVIQFFQDTYNLKMDIDDLGMLVKRNTNSYLLLDRENEVLKGVKDFRSGYRPKSPLAGKIKAKALVDYYAKDIPIEDTIKASQDIRDFYFVQGNSKRSWNVHLDVPWADAPVRLQNTTRWLVSQFGGYLSREGINSGKTERIMKGIRVQPEMEMIAGEDPSKYPIDYDWYINSTKEMIV